jgi:hypothetical protein
VRLDPAEVVQLPLAAALVDRQDDVLAHTPEWRGAPPGSVTYDTGEALLLVSPGDAERPEQDAVMRRLLDEIATAGRAMPREQALRTAVLSSGLELVAGWPHGGGSGTAEDVLEHAAAAIRARVPEASLELAPGPAPAAVLSPARIALALVQLAVNAADHEAAARLRLRVGLGPSFYVEWPSAGPATVEATGHRHPALRRRWGLGYVRMVADALGATALPPGPTQPGWAGACLSLGSRRLTLPLALLRGRALVRCTQTWEQEVRTPDTELQAAIGADLAAVTVAAEAQPGAIQRGSLFAARRSAAGTWVTLPPDIGAAAVRDVLRGLDHERPLWSAAEPHATRVHGLIAALAISLGGPPVAFAPDVFAREFPRACAALGVPVPETGPMLACPDPRLTAFLLSELGGRLLVRGDGVWLEGAASSGGDALRALLGGGGGPIRLTPAG